MTKIIHLSDLHIGAENSALERVKKIFKKIVFFSKNRSQEYLVLITGDLVERGANQFYKEAKEQFDFLKSKNLELFVVPGNHDYLASAYDLPIIRKIPLVRDFPWISFSYQRIQQFNKIFIDSGFNFKQNKETYPILKEFQDFFLIGLDSQYGEYTRNSYEIFWNADGSIGKKQLDNLKKILVNLQEKKKRKVLCLHHHPVEKGPIHATLTDYKKFQSLLEKHPVDLILFGHKHISQELSLFGKIPCYNAGSSTSVRKNFKDKKWRKEAKIRIFDLAEKDLRKISYLNLESEVEEKTSV